MTRASRSTTTRQNVKNSSQVMYTKITSPLYETSGKVQNMKRYFPDEFHKESNRTVWLPLREVGSLNIILPWSAQFVNPVSWVHTFLPLLL